MKILYVAAFVGPEVPGWFSVGRYRKIDQVLRLLTDLGFSILGLNIAPVKGSWSNYTIHNLCHSTLLPVRLFQITKSSFSYFLASVEPRDSSILWLYNTRAAEAIVAVVALILRPSLKLVIQLEDLPFARKENHCFAGLVDQLFMLLLSLRADLIFTVSGSVGNSFTAITKSLATKPHTLPPFLDDLFLDKVVSRPEPFSGDSVNVFYAGSYLSEKGVEDLLTAFRTLSTDKFKLFLAGPAPSALIRLFQDSHNIIFLGLLENSALFNRLAIADVVVNPHRPTSNSDFIFPYKLVELIASGALPLTTRVSGADTFQLPTDCYFSNATELAEKLRNSHLIWSRNRRQIRLVSIACRQAYSSQSVRSDLRDALGNLA